jgi:hypothetical protein
MASALLSCRRQHTNVFAIRNTFTRNTFDNVLVDGELSCVVRPSTGRAAHPWNICFHAFSLSPPFVDASSTESVLATASTLSVALCATQLHGLALFYRGTEGL